MSLVTLALILVSAALHATWNLWAKQIGPQVRSSTLMFALTAISAVTYAPLAFA